MKTSNRLLIGHKNKYILALRLALRARFRGISALRLKRKTRAFGAQARTLRGHRPLKGRYGAQNSKYKLEGKILHQQCNRLFPARCQTYAN